MDKDGSKSVNIGEMTVSMKDILTDEECIAIFMAIDKNRDNSVT